MASQMVQELEMRMEETLRHSRRNVTSLTNTYVYCVNVRSRKNVRLLRDVLEKMYVYCKRKVKKKVRI